MDNTHFKQACDEMKVCQTQILTQSQSESIRPFGSYKSVIIKVPVILSKTRVHIDIESLIELDHPAFSIRHTDKNVYVTQCTLLDNGNKRDGKVFINGYIRESIEYVGADAEQLQNISSIHNMITKIPFNCTTKIEYFELPLLTDKTQEKITMSNYNCQYNRTNFKKISDKIYFEIEQININDMQNSNLLNDHNFETTHFTQVMERMVVSITFIILQNQQLCIPRNYIYK